jgi:hypothetical protein
LAIALAVKETAFAEFSIVATGPITVVSAV